GELFGGLGGDLVLIVVRACERTHNFLLGHQSHRNSMSACLLYYAIGDHLRLGGFRTLQYQYFRQVLIEQLRYLRTKRHADSIHSFAEASFAPVEEFSLPLEN